MQVTSIVMGIVCALSIVDPLLLPECAALALTLATLEIDWWFFCETI